MRSLHIALCLLSVTRTKAQWDLIEGGSGPDNLVGTAKNEIVVGKGGDDTLTAKGGWDFVRGKTGNDFLRGGADKDGMTGSAGDDTIYGSGGTDYISAGVGADLAFGGPGKDRITGNTGEDVLHGNGGDDFISGGPSDDTLLGEVEDDVLQGRSGDDTLLGGVGFDKLQGFSGNDLLIPGGKGASPSVVPSDVSSYVRQEYMYPGTGHDVVVCGDAFDAITYEASELLAKAKAGMVDVIKFFNGTLDYRGIADTVYVWVADTALTPTSFKSDGAFLTLPLAGVATKVVEFRDASADVAALLASERILVQ